MNYLAEIPFEINDEPVTIGVTHFYKQEARPFCTDSDIDYYGYTEAEWDILDESGVVHNELDDPDLWDNIEQAIIDHFEKIKNDY